MQRKERLALLLAMAAVLGTTGCSGTGGEQRALDAATAFVDSAASVGLTGSVGTAERHGPWWEVTVWFEERDAVVLFVDPEEYSVEYVERAPDEVVTPAEFFARPVGMEPWQLGQSLPGSEPEAFRPDIFSSDAQFGFHLHSSLVPSIHNRRRRHHEADPHDLLQCQRYIRPQPQSPGQQRCESAGNVRSSHQYPNRRKGDGRKGRPEDEPLHGLRVKIDGHYEAREE